LGDRNHQVAFMILPTLDKVVKPSRHFQN
jgi:hypothetical protein